MGKDGEVEILSLLELSMFHWKYPEKDIVWYMLQTSFLSLIQQNW